jgi:hypothetical protein
MHVSPEKQLARLRAMSTAELLDRVTVLQPQMEPDAIEMMHAELAGRGIGPDEIGAHLRDMRLLVINNEKGQVASCSRCGRAAVSSHDDWHRLWKLVPLFKRTYYYCQDHTPPKL